MMCDSRYREDFWRPRLKEDGACTMTHPENDDGHDGRWIHGQVQDAVRKDQLQWVIIGSHIHLRPPSVISFQGLLSNFVWPGQLEYQHPQYGSPQQGICQTETVNPSDPNTSSSDTDPNHHTHSRHLCTCGHWSEKSLTQNAHLV